MEDLTIQTFKDSTRDRVVIDFWADWCRPCHMLHPALEKLEEAGVNVKRVNIDEEHELAQMFRIQSIPTLVLMENGQEQKRLTGVRPYPELLRELA
jgi:thioredoxin 1